jgi:hypothetical protein
VVIVEAERSCGVRDLVRVELPDNELIWAVVEGSGSQDVGFGPPRQVLSGLTETIRGIAGNVRQAVRDAAPDEFSVEFGVELAMGKEGLVAALVGIDGTASIKVTVAWKSGEPANPAH